MNMKRAIALVVFLVVPFLCQAQAAVGFTKVATVTTLTYSDASCPNQSTCYYQVTAVDAQGFESSPAPCGASQLCVSGNIAVAVMPSSGTHTVALAWTASPTAGVSGYNVYRHIGPLSAGSLTATVN